MEQKIEMIPWRLIAKWGQVCALILVPAYGAAKDVESWQYLQPGHTLYLNNAETAGIVLTDGQTALLAVEPDGEWVVAAITLKGTQYETSLTSHLIHANGKKTSVVIDGEKLFRADAVKDGMLRYNFLMHSRDLELFQASSIWRLETALYQVEFPLENSRKAIQQAIAAVLVSDQDTTQNRVAIEAAMRACDLLAADPDDSASMTPGVIWADMDGPAAVAACEQAEATGNDTGRLYFQLGRAYHKAQNPRALETLTTAGLGLEYPLAFSALGRFYRDGTYVTQDMARAREIFQRGHALGNLASGYDYARVLITHGDGDADLITGRDILQGVADTGYAPAQRSYGRWLLEGRFGVKDHAAALRYLAMAATHGDAEAAHDLAVIYRDGLGVSADPGLYRVHLEKAAELGHAAAIETLALD